MSLLTAWRARRVAAGLAVYRPFYDRPDDVEARQLARFNAGWAESLARSPWARATRARLALPDRFASWAEFNAKVPVQRKAQLGLDLAAAGGEPPEPVLWRSTGGTTAEPMRFPVFPSETGVAALDIWLGRERLGVSPDDRLFLIWGHSHIFGTGLQGAIARARRRLSDMALGYVRWNAYRLAPEDLRRGAEALLRSRARYVVGYASALDRFARANLDRADAFRRLGLTAVIATAEGFPQADSRAMIEACLGCPVAMEYGAVETGPVAYERPGGGAGGGYDVFWAHHRVEAIDTEATFEGREIVVTSLSPRALPLLRYAIGDLVSVDGEPSGGLTGFQAVRGRCNEATALPDGSLIHSEAFTHVVRDAPGVRAYQIVRRGGRLPKIRYEAARPLAAESANALAQRMALIHPALAEVELEWVTALPPSVAGKHRMVIDEA